VSDRRSQNCKADRPVATTLSPQAKMFFVSTKPRPLAAPELSSFFAFVQILNEKEKKKNGAQRQHIAGLRMGSKLENVGHTSDKPDFAGFWHCVYYWGCGRCTVTGRKDLEKKLFCIF